MDDFARAFLQSCRDQGKDPVAMVKLASAISPHIAKSLAGIEKEAILPSVLSPGMALGAKPKIPTGTQNLINASNMWGKQEANIPLPQSKPIPQPNITPSPHVRGITNDPNTMYNAAKGGLGTIAHGAATGYGVATDAIAKATNPLRSGPQDAMTANRMEAPWLSGDWLSPGTTDQATRTGQAFQQGIGTPQLSIGAKGTDIPSVSSGGQVRQHGQAAVNTNGQASPDIRSQMQVDPTQDPLSSMEPTQNGPHRRNEFLPSQLGADANALSQSSYLPEGQRTLMGALGPTVQGGNMALTAAPLGVPAGLTALGVGAGAAHGAMNTPTQTDVQAQHDYTQAASKAGQPALTAEQMGLPGSQPTPPAPETPTPDLNKFEDLVSQAQSNPQYIQQLSEKGDGYLQSAMDVNIPPEQRQEAFAMGAQHKLALASVEAGVPAAEKVQQIAEQGMSPQDAVAAAEKAAPNDPEAQAGIFEQVGQMPDWAQVLMWGGLGLGAVGLFQQLFGGDDEGGGGSMLPMLMTLLGIGGAGYAAVQGGLMSNPFGGGGEQPPADPGATGGVAPQGLGVNSMMMGLGAGNLGGMAARMPGLRGLLTSGVESGVQGVTGLKPEILREMVKGMSPQQLEQYAAQIAQPAAERGMDPMQLQGLLQNYHTAIQ